MPDQLALQMNDAQPKAGPAFSATSDTPDIKPEPPKISEEVNTKAAKVEKPATEEKTEKAASAGEKTETGAEKPGDEKTASAEEGAEGQDGADETPAWLKARITKETNKRRVAEAAAEVATKRVDALTANLTKALEGIEALTKAQAATITKEADKEDPRPVRETFEDPTTYENALVDWADRRAKLVAKADAEKAVADALTKEKTETQAKADKERNDKVLADFAERKAKFVEDHPDYDALVEKEDKEHPENELQISIPMANCILTDEDGPAIAYYLGQNPDEATRISKLPGVQAIAAMGRIAARLNSKPAPVTKPAPITPLKTGAENAVTKSPAEMSMDEYGAMRNRQIANEKRTRMGLAPLN